MYLEARSVVHLTLVVFCCMFSLILQTELKHFVSNMWENQLLTNVTDGLTYLDDIDDGDGAFNFSQLEHMLERYPTLSPAGNVIACIFYFVIINFVLIALGLILGSLLRYTYSSIL